MPRIKIVIMSTDSYYDDYDSYSHNIIRSGITEWEEISEKQYDFLMQHKGYHLDAAMKVPSGSTAIIIRQDEEGALLRVESIEKLIKKMEEDRIKEENERRAKKEAAALARKLKKEAKTKEEELALLAALKAKHENN